MKKSKIFAVPFTAIMLSTTSAVSSAPAPTIIQNTPAVKTETSHIVTREVASSSIFPYESQVINPTHHTGGAYTGSFTTAPANGKFLNVWVQNLSSSTVYLTIKRNNVEFISPIAIAGSTQRTQQFEEQVAAGISGNWQVYVYSSTGNLLDINVSARQF
ncbi:hypothetical protein [Paenibacillus sp. CF384]|uniref:hypothetical protein n=1 Tax=Paenibacillus sp. CF384 TaxID=1884382 RepID=UPI00089A3C49|nr:hypothetical protein [Paenibacillus sp. CF384]SDX74650.1 hypothetical protein SAMN05518855_102049 [Paenibacillus sp. CF384]